MMLKRIRKLGAWLTILLVVLFLISALIFNMGLAGSGAGTGVFSYWFRARFQVWPDTENSPAISGSVNVEGNAEPRFMVWGHASPRYRKLEIDWVIFRDGESKGQAVIDLNEMQILHGTQNSPLNADSLCSLIGLTNTTNGEGLMVTTLIDFLESAREGTLPPPNHHGYSLPKPLPGKMQHFATGFSLRPLELAWVGAWSIFGLFGWIKPKHIADDSAKQAQPKRL